MRDSDSQRIMKAVDCMSEPMRALVHEYGFRIVHEMCAEGYTNAAALRPILEGWRRRRQEEWLLVNERQLKQYASTRP
jgi:hypothetical protein